MSLYPEKFRRCQHIKVNGIQCGSPAMRDERFCYFHMRWHNTGMSVMDKDRDHWLPGLPTLEDANSIQVGLAEVMRLLVTQELDHKTGALMLYAMQTASSNLRWTSIEPDQPTQVVIDRDSVAQRPIGATAWSKVEGREYDDAEGEDTRAEDPREDDASEQDAREDASAEGWDSALRNWQSWDSLFKYVIDRQIADDPENVNRTLGDLRGLLAKKSVEG